MEQELLLSTEAELESDCIQLEEGNEPNIDSLECAYELANAKGYIHKSAQEYVYALENLVSQMQAKSFTDSSKLTALEYDIDELKNLIPKLLEASGE